MNQLGCQKMGATQKGCRPSGSRERHRCSEANTATARRMAPTGEWGPGNHPSALYNRALMNPPEMRPEVERSLALHREVAERLRRDPELLAAARERVERWLTDGSVHGAWAKAWRSILDAGLDRVIEVLTDASPAAHDLRQVSPFAGALDPRTRWTILRACSSGRPAS